MLAGCLCGCGKDPELSVVSQSGNAMGRYVEQDFPLPEGGAALDMVMLTTGQLRVAARDGDGNLLLYTSGTDRRAWEQTETLPEKLAEQVYVETLSLSPTGEVFYSTVQKEEGGYQYHFWVIDSTGEKREIPITYPEMDAEAGFLLSYSDFTDDGRLLAMFYFQDVREIDLKTGSLSENKNEQEAHVRYFGCAGQSAYILGKSSGSICREGETQVLPGVLRDQLLASLQATEGYSSKLRFWENSDGYLFFTTHDGLYSYAPGGSVTEELVSGGRSSLGDPTFFPKALTGAEDGSFYVLGQGVLGQGAEAALYHYVYDPEAPTQPSIQLRLYSLYEDENLRQMVSQYQKSHPEVAIDLEIGLTGEDGVTVADALRTLNTRILAGSGPDMLRLDGLSIDTYLEKGLLSDLSGVLEESGPLLEQVTNCYAQDGKICAVPTTFALPAMYGAEHIVSQIHDLDSLVTAARQARAENPEMDRIVYGMNPVMMANQYYDSCSAAWLNSDGTLDAGKLAEFYEAMNALYALDESFRQENAQWVAEMATELDSFLEGIGEYTGLGGASYIFNNISYLSSGTLDGMAQWSSVLAGEEEFLGDGYKTISFSGQVSNVFLPRRIMGILTTSAHQKAAQEFLSFMLSDEVQSKDLTTGFPVNKTTFDREIAEERTAGTTFGVSDEDGNHVTYKAKWPDATRRQELKTWVENLTTPALTDRTIRSKVMDQMVDCCNGKITPQQAADAALRSLNLYLSE